jgi:glycerophosphoryl diester phosphodiesterase
MPLDLRRPAAALPKVVGHRGASAVAPENTLASFDRAWRDGADVVEFDLHLSADGQVVVIHDATLERTTNGTGYVSETPLSELKRLDAGSWFSPAYAGEPIPTLRELLVWAKGKIGLLMELKFHPYGSFDPALVPSAVAVIDETNTWDQVAAISYQPRALAQIKLLAPHVPAGPLLPRDRLLRFGAWLARRVPGLGGTDVFRKLLIRPLQFTRTWGCDVVAPNIVVVSPVLVEASHRAGFPLSCGGLMWNYPEAIRMGVDTISANDPGLVRSRYL